MRIDLRMKHGNIKLVGMALLLMLLGSFVIVLGPRPYYYAPREPMRHAHSVPFNVSLIDSEWNYSIKALSYFFTLPRIGITEMETNGTPLGLAIQNGNNVTVFAVSGVSRIANSSLVVPASDDCKIIVTREFGDANGSLVILLWEMPPPPPIDPLIISFVPTFIFLIVPAMIVFWKIVKVKTARQSIRPFWVAVLVVVGLALVSPYITGSWGGFFTPAYVTEQFPLDSRTLVLNATYPNGFVPFGNEVPSNTESFRIRSFEDDNKKYYFELHGANDEVILSATHVNSSIAWEIRGDFVSPGYSLNFERVDVDVDVSLSIEIGTRTTRIPVEPLPSTILAIMGLAALILAIATGFSVQTREKVRQN